MVEARIDPRLRSRIGASDILQEVSLEAIQRIDRYWVERPMPFFLWLRYLAAQRLAQVHRFQLGTEKRDARREVAIDWSDVRSSAEAIAPSMTDGGLRPSQILSRRETESLVSDALAGMDTEDREVLSLRHHEQLSNQEVACELGITLAAASKRYLRALDRLRARLESEPSSPEAGS